MGKLIDHPYRYFSPELIEKLILAGYLKRSEQHNVSAVKKAFERIIADGDKALTLRF